MAPADEIESFLTNKTDYSYGISLLASVHKNIRLIHNLSKKETPTNWEKLIYELKKYIKSNPVKTTQHGKENLRTNENQEFSPESTRTKLSPIAKIYNKSIEIGAQKELLPSNSSSHNSHLAISKSALLDKVRENRMLLYRNRGHLHGRLHEAPTNEIRFELAKNIIAIQSDIEKINKDLSLIESGNIPRELVLDMMSGSQHKEYRNTQNYIVRYANYLKKDDLTDEKRKGYELKLEHYQSKIENFFANV